MRRRPKTCTRAKERLSIHRYSRQSFAWICALPFQVDRNCRSIQGCGTPSIKPWMVICNPQHTGHGVSVPRPADKRLVPITSSQPPSTVRAEPTRTVNNLVQADVVQRALLAHHRIMSLISSPSCTSQDIQAMVVATSVSRNISSGNAVQINGPVADKVYNLNFKTLVVSPDCKCGWGTEIVSSGNESALPSRCAAKMPNKSKVLKTPSSSKVSGKFTVQLPKKTSDKRVLQGQNLTLNSSTSDARHVVRAIFRPTVLNNFIAHKIVRRLSLVVYSGSSFTMEATSDRIHLPPTNDYVDLARYSQEGKEEFAICRFYVVKDSRFDLLFGAGSVNT